MEIIELLTHHPRTAGIRLDLSISNSELASLPKGDAEELGNWIQAQLQSAGAQFGYGGYLETRGFYPDSHFGGTEPRNLHLGLDIWLPAGTPIFLPFPGQLHSFADNNRLGDYGPTLIFAHHWEGKTFYTLFGHLSRPSLENCAVGHVLAAGTPIATLGEPAENVGWPPHLHFQVILDLLGQHGDFPGVAAGSEREFWARNCPDPMLPLDHLFALVP